MNDVLRRGHDVTHFHPNAVPDVGITGATPAPGRSTTADPAAGHEAAGNAFAARCFTTRAGAGTFGAGRAGTARRTVSVPPSGGPARRGPQRSRGRGVCGPNAAAEEPATVNPGQPTPPTVPPPTKRRTPRQHTVLPAHEGRTAGEPIQTGVDPSTPPLGGRGSNGRVEEGEGFLPDIRVGRQQLAINPTDHTKTHRGLLTGFDRVARMAGPGDFSPGATPSIALPSLVLRAPSGALLCARTPCMPRLLEARLTRVRLAVGLTGGRCWPERVWSRWVCRSPR